MYSRWLNVCLYEAIKNFLSLLILIIFFEWDFVVSAHWIFSWLLVPLPVLNCVNVFRGETVSYHSRVARWQDKIKSIRQQNFNYFFGRSERKHFSQYEKEKYFFLYFKRREKKQAHSKLCITLRFVPRALKTQQLGDGFESEKRSSQIFLLYFNTYILCRDF